MSCCDHKRSLLVQSAHGPDGREHITICAECGNIHLFVEDNGHSFTRNFSLYNSETLIAASQAYRRTKVIVDDEQKQKLVAKPLDFAGLRLYQVRLWFKYKGEQHGQSEMYVVATTSPSRAAEIIKQTYHERYEQSPFISEWHVQGYPLKVLQPLAWTENGIALVNEKLLEEHAAQAARIQELEALINIPHTDDFLQAVPLEAAHQLARWGNEHDAGKGPEDWFWLIGYLAGKALRAAIAGDVAKAKHHTISTAAAMLNWWRRLSGLEHTMRPGIAPPAEQGEL